MPGLRVWRLCKHQYAGRAFSGEGAQLLGGRWNPVGIPLVYASLSLSLAVLEVFVHMKLRSAPEDYVSVKVDLGIDDQQAERVDVTALPPDWKRLESSALKEIGREWAEAKRSLVLLVPSVVIEEEWNALVNPLHPDAARMKIAEPKLFQFDERMFRAQP